MGHNLKDFPPHSLGYKEKWRTHEVSNQNITSFVFQGQMTDLKDFLLFMEIREYFLNPY